MKKLSVVLSLLMLFGFVGFAGATQWCDGFSCPDGEYEYEDVVKLGVNLTERRDITYTHDLTDDVTPGYKVTDATLALTFLEYDGYFFFWEYKKFEHVKLAFDGDTSTWFKLGEVDTGTYDMTVDLDLLDDLKLDVTLSVYDHSRCDFADVGVLYSKLYGCAAPVPEPGTFLLLGAGLVGLVGYRRYTKK